MSIEVKAIVEAARGLNRAQRLELVTILASLDLEESKAPSREALVRSIQGKYKHVPTSVEGFLHRKLEDTARESA
jgi:hypothetical protein